MRLVSATLLDRSLLQVIDIPSLSEHKYIVSAEESTLIKYCFNEVQSTGLITGSHLALENAYIVTIIEVSLVNSEENISDLDVMSYNWFVYVTQNNFIWLLYYELQNTHFPASYYNLGQLLSRLDLSKQYTRLGKIYCPFQILTEM